MVNLWKRNFLLAIWMSPFTSVRGLWKLDILGAFTFCWSPNNLNFFFLLKLFQAFGFGRSWNCLALTRHGRVGQLRITFWQHRKVNCHFWQESKGTNCAWGESWLLESKHSVTDGHILSIVGSYLQIIWEPLASKKKKNELGHDKSYLSLF